METVTTPLGIHECLDKLKQITDAPKSYIDEIPEVLKKDFMAFIAGKTISVQDGRSITYDMKAYIDKIIYKGISYRIEWNVQTA